MVRNDCVPLLVLRFAPNLPPASSFKSMGWLCSVDILGLFLVSGGCREEAGHLTTLQVGKVDFVLPPVRLSSPLRYLAYMSAATTTEPETHPLVREGSCKQRRPNVGPLLYQVLWMQPISPAIVALRNHLFAGGAGGPGPQAV
jgi:hypothetical protein